MSSNSNRDESRFPRVCTRGPGFARHSDNLNHYIGSGLRIPHSRVHVRGMVSGRLLVREWHPRRASLTVGGVDSFLERTYGLVELLARLKLGHRARFPILVFGHREVELWVLNIHATVYHTPATAPASFASTPAKGDPIALSVFT